METPKISVVIPVFNSSQSIGPCLEALSQSAYPNFEVIVVDDCSSDDSVEIIRQFPFRLIMLDRNSGPGIARNTGARESTGDIIFFIDADCVITPGTLSAVAESVSKHPGAVIGGSYTPVAYDDTFFSTFQSAFIHFSETRSVSPDYVATHAMAIRRSDFLASGGFRQNLLTRSSAIEDVEFSHRLRGAGMRLVMNPDILVSHMFGFTIGRSLWNAYRKSKYWTVYSIGNRDLFKDSGTASVDLKMNVAAVSAAVFALILSAMLASNAFFLTGFLIFAVNCILQRNLFSAFHRAKGTAFALSAAVYYTTFFAAAVALGSAAGFFTSLSIPRENRWV